MGRKSILLLGILIISAAARAQHRFDQAFGLGYSRSNLSTTALATKGTSYMLSNISVRLHTAGIVYQVRRDLVGWKGGSISLGAPVTAGIGWTTRYHSVDTDGTNTYQYGDSISASSLAFDLPLVADLNIGLHSAADESRNSFGVYVGAGYAYSFTRIRTTVGRRTYDGFEPVLRAGIRLGNAWERRWGIAFSIRGSWDKGSNKTYALQLLKEL